MMSFKTNFLLSVILLLSGVVFGTPTKTLKNFLIEGGSFDLNSDYEGPIDISGYKFQYGKDGSPVFTPSNVNGDSAWNNNPVCDPTGVVTCFAKIGTDLYIGGQFTTVGGIIANRIAKWDGANWSALGSGLNSWVNCMAVIGTDLYVGGFFQQRVT